MYPIPSAIRRPGRRPRHRLLTGTTLAIGLSLVASLSVAQERQRVGLDEQDLDFANHRLNSFFPRSGPPGTIVTLHATDMPPLAPFRIGVGALRFGFEETGWVLADDNGAFETEIVIPSWARYDVVHLFIVFDPYFVPVALSGIFHVTDADGNVQRNGRVIDEGKRCVILRGPDRVPYALLGDLVGFSTGDEVIVEGPIVDAPGCPGTTAIRVVRIQPGEEN